MITQKSLWGSSVYEAYFIDEELWLREGKQLAQFHLFRKSGKTSATTQAVWVQGKSLSH